MSKVLYNHWYTKAEIDGILEAGGMNNPALLGYYLETDGKRFRLIHNRDSVAAGIKRSGEVVGDPWGDIDPIVRRTPQQRVDSIVSGIIRDCMAHGSVPGFSNQRMTDLLGYKWVTGVSVMTEEVARQVAGHFLHLAEAKRNRDEAHFSVKPSQNDIINRS